MQPRAKLPHRTSRHETALATCVALLAPCLHAALLGELTCTSARLQAGSMAAALCPPPNSLACRPAHLCPTARGFNGGNVLTGKRDALQSKEVSFPIISKSLFRMNAHTHSCLNM